MLILTYFQKLVIDYFFSAEVSEHRRLKPVLCPIVKGSNGQFSIIFRMCRGHIDKVQMSIKFTRILIYLSIFMCISFEHKIIWTTTCQSIFHCDRQRVCKMTSAQKIAYSLVFTSTVKTITIK